MSKVIADISMSLDGYVTGPDPGVEQGLGVGGEALHTWAIDSDDPIDVAVLAGATEQSGAVIMGRRLFDIIDAPGGWDDSMGYGAEHAGTPPFFVVTHTPPSAVRLGLDFTFVTDGPAAAIDQARPAAGEGHVVIMGGGDVIRQCLFDGLLDELRLHLAPVVLGRGTPLFRPGDRQSLVQTSAEVSSTAAHLTYEVIA